jgi:hypothetical protein
MWNILQPFSTLYGRNVVAIWYIFPRFGILCKEKSGNKDDCDFEMMKWYDSTTLNPGGIQISRPIAPQAETLPLDHGARAWCFFRFEHLLNIFGPIASLKLKKFKFLATYRKFGNLTETIFDSKRGVQTN